MSERPRYLTAENQPAIYAEAINRARMAIEDPKFMKNSTRIRRLLNALSSRSPPAIPHSEIRTAVFGNEIQTGWESNLRQMIKQTEGTLRRRGLFITQIGSDWVLMSIQIKERPDDAHYNLRLRPTPPVATDRFYANAQPRFGR